MAADEREWPPGRQHASSADDRFIWQEDDTVYNGIDVNSATAVGLATVPGIGPDLAARIVKIRDRAGGFSSLEDFATLLDLPRDQVDALRGALLFSA
jgi:DNA uptake protein ComE-like DNA-binding protein